jgi:hypothetical protein
MVRNYERVLSDANRLNYVLDRWTEGQVFPKTARVQLLIQFFLIIMLKMLLTENQKYSIRITLNSKVSEKQE